MITYEKALGAAIDAAREAAILLRDDFHRSEGARGSGDHAEADIEAERIIRARLTSAMPAWGYLGEETGSSYGTSDHMWVVDPNDGTKQYLKGARGSSVSIAALCGHEPVLGVVYAFAYPDGRGDLIAWARGCGPVRRNGGEVRVDISRERLTKDSVVLVSLEAERNAGAGLTAAAPARIRTVTSIAYRLALAAVGEGVAAVSLHSPCTWDYAAGHALLAASGGAFLDENSRPVTYADRGRSSTRWCFGGSPEAARELAGRSWDDVFSRPTAPFRPFFPLARLRPGQAVSDSELLSRAQGCLLGQITGDALGALVEFRRAEEIAASYPLGVRELADGGTHNTLAGQPTDDSEMALMLGRSLVKEGCFDPRKVVDAYVHWYESNPFDLGSTVSAALGAAAGGRTPSERLRRAQESADSASQANGSLMRVSPLGIFGWHNPEEAAVLALVDGAITHPNEVCREACAVFVKAIAAAIAGAGAEGAYEAALAEGQVGKNPVISNALQKARQTARPEYPDNPGWVVVALQNAFHQLLHAPTLEEGLVATVSRGGDTDTNAAICGALLGAVYGRESIPQRWWNTVLSCRPAIEANAAHPRPAEFWPVDALELAEALLLSSSRSREAIHDQ